jgi:serine/threonine-protein kinase
VTDLPPADQWSALSSLLDSALDLPEGDRTAWLDNHAAKDPEQAAWLRRVLAQLPLATAQDYLQRPVIEPGDDPAIAAGSLIGVYRLLRKLGSRGMGVVWLAERSDGHLRRTVALKLPHAHLLAGSVRERFAREGNILARLQHPHIATLYDAGLAGNGRPYLALEYAEGLPITQWCREHAADIDTRLELVSKVMQAVAYAHARLIVHRDIKPSNVLVTADGDVKLLDFGIAKLLAGDDESADSPQTRFGMRLATPGYAAPEQIAGETATTQADVYALGVMLCELLCGQTPSAEAMRASLRRSTPPATWDRGQLFHPRFEQRELARNL